jgi:nucleoside-diphosphate-sugar epimerase
MTALVTGAGGFTGGHLARYLAAAGDRVRAMVRTRDTATGLDRPGIEIVEGDLTDRASLARAIAGADVVYNIAARYREANLAASTYHAVNAEAVGTIIQLAREAGARRVVHCSTVGVHGDVEHPPANEEAPFRPGDIYQETKVGGEAMARHAAAAYGMDVVIARPTGIYGPGDRRLFKLFGKIAARKFVMLGSGRNFYHVTYIDDLCEGFRLCGTVPAATGRTYILGGGEVTTLRALVDITAEVAGVPPPRVTLPVWPVWLAGAVCEAVFTPIGMSPPIYRRRVDFFRKSRAFDITRARRELGYAPAVGLREGIRRTLDWYREHGWI